MFFIGIKELCTDCTCGQFLIDSESKRKFNKQRLDAISIPNYVIKKGRSHGARHGKTEEQKEYQKAWNAWKRCCKRVDSQDEHYEGIHDRFLKDQVYRESQLKIGWTKQKCIEMDELAKQDHTYHLSKKEFIRYQGQWYLTLNKSGKNTPMRLRPDFRAAVSLKNRLHRESGALFLRRFLVGHVQKLVFFKEVDSFFVTVRFVYSRWRCTVTDGGCRQEHLTRHFLLHSAHTE